MKVYRTALGTGPEQILEFIDRGEMRTVILPNRVLIERAKGRGREGRGSLGTDYFTFDDVIEKLALARPRGERRVLYYFRRELARGETTFKDLRDLGRVRALFLLLEEIEEGGVEPEALPYSWRGELEALIGARRQAAREVGYRSKEALLQEALEADIYGFHSVDVFGFTGFSDGEWALLEKLDRHGEVRLHLPFGPLSSPDLDRHLGELDAIRAEGELANLSLYRASGMERGIRHLTECVYETLSDDPAARIGILITDENLRAPLETALEGAGIPVSRRERPIDEATLGTLRCLWRLDETIPSISAYLRSPLAPREGAALARILESLGMESLKGWSARKKFRLFLDPEQRELLFEALPLLRERMHHRPESYDGFKEATEAVLDGLDKEEAETLREAMDAGLGDYGRISGEEFESILLANMDTEAVDGVAIHSLTAGYGGEYDRLFVMNLDRGFPCPVGEDCFVHANNVDVLEPLGLIGEEKAPEGDVLALSYSLASAKASAVYHLGEGEAARVFESWAEVRDVIDLDGANEVFRKSDLSTASADLSPKLAGQLDEELKQGSISPTSVDLFRSCPFKYFGEKILGLEERSRNKALNLAKGNLYHGILEDYFRGDLKQDALGEEVARRFEALEDLVAEHLHEMERRGMTRALLSTIQGEEERLEDPKRNGAFRPVRTEAAYTYPFEGYTLRGKIDRIDEDGSGREVLVDYKSGGVPKLNAFVGYEKMQLALYALARRYIDREPVSLEYVSVEGSVSVMARNTDFAGSYKGLRKERKKSTEEMAAFLEGAEDALGEVLSAMAAGRFSPNPLNEEVCRYCHLNDLCRKEEACSN